MRSNSAAERKEQEEWHAEQEADGDVGVPAAEGDVGVPAAEGEDSMDSCDEEDDADVCMMTSQHTRHSSTSSLQTDNTHVTMHMMMLSSSRRSY